MLLGDDDTDTVAKPARSSPFRHRPPTARSRVGNGKMLMAGMDLRSAIYREFQDCCADLASHMGGDPTAVEAALIEESAGLILWCRHSRASLLRGEEFDLVNYTPGRQHPPPAACRHRPRTPPQERHALDLRLRQGVRDAGGRGMTHLELFPVWCGGKAGYLYNVTTAEIRNAISPGCYSPAASPVWSS
jgi:hypothetical protein